MASEVLVALKHENASQRDNLVRAKLFVKLAPTKSMWHHCLEKTAWVGYWVTDLLRERNPILRRKLYTVARARVKRDLHRRREII